MAMLIMSSNVLHFARLSHYSLYVVEVLDNKRLQLPADEQLVLEHHAAQLLIHWSLISSSEC